MSDFVIPKGLDFEFTVRVIEADSFLAQDLRSMDISAGNGPKLRLSKLSAPDITVLTIDLDVIDTESSLNGMLSGTIDAADTIALEWELGPKEDGNYLKPVYRGVITLDPVIAPKIMTVIENIYVTPTGL